MQAQPVTPAAPPAPNTPAAPAAPAPVQAAPDPLLAYLNSTPAAPVEPEAPAKDTDAALTDGDSYSLDDILAEFSDF